MSPVRRLHRTQGTPEQSRNPGRFSDRVGDLRRGDEVNRRTSRALLGGGVAVGYWADGDDAQPALTARDGLDWAIDLFFSDQGLLCAYDEIYVWDWVADLLLDLINDVPDLPARYVRDLFEVGILQSVPWPGKTYSDDEAEARFLAGIEAVGFGLAPELAYTVDPDERRDLMSRELVLLNEPDPPPISRLLGLIAELEAARQSRRGLKLVVASQQQFSWCQHIGEMARDRDRVKQLVTQYVPEFEEDEDREPRTWPLPGWRPSDARRLLLPREVDSPSVAQQVGGLFLALVPDVDQRIRRALVEGSPWNVEVILSEVVDHRARLAAFRAEVEAVVREMDRVADVPADELAFDQRAQIAMDLFREHCRRVEEALLETSRGSRRFHRVMTTPLFGLLLDWALWATSAATGVPVNVPGASVLPAYLGEAVRSRAITSAIDRGVQPSIRADWYCSWLDLQTRRRDARSRR